MRQGMSYNGMHPQRRRMFNVHKNHNLRSNIDFVWIESLEVQEPKRYQVINEKKSRGYSEAIKNYNQFIDEELNNRYQSKDHRFPIANSQNPQSYSSRNSSNQKNREPNFKAEQKLDYSLNQELGRYDLSESRNIDQIESDMLKKKSKQLMQNQQANDRVVYRSFGPNPLRNNHLKSALDRPDLYQYYNRSQEKYKLRNQKPDALQSYLRGMENGLYRH